MTERGFQQLFLAMMLAALAWALAWVIGAIAANIRRARTARYLAEAHGQVLERLATAPELLGYLEGRAGQRLFETLTMDVRTVSARIMDAIQFGVVLSLLGLSLLLLSLVDGDVNSRRTLLHLGVPTMAVGAGFLVSAYVSYSLSKTWQLLDRGEPSPPAE